MAHLFRRWWTVAASLMMASCGLNNGDDWKEKTWPGCLLFRYADEQIRMGSDALRSVVAFETYYVAEDDVARKEIFDRYSEVARFPRSGPLSIFSIRMAPCAGSG